MKSKFVFAIRDLSGEELTKFYYELRSTVQVSF